MRRFPIGTILGVVVSLATLLGCIALFPRLLYPETSFEAVTDMAKRLELQQAQRALENNARAMLLQGFAGLLLVVGAVSTWRQLRIARDGNITDRFGKAVEQLGGDRVELRLGGIYALERIVRNSPADRLAAIEILTAFIRTNSPAEHPGPPDADADPSRPKEETPWLQVRAPDIQAAVNVLGHTPPATEGISLHLPQVDLRRVYLSRARLVRPRMRAADLSGAWARHAHLVHAYLRRTNLDDANLEHSSLVAANLSEASLVRANLDGAYLQDAFLEGANLMGATLRGADLTRSVLRGANLVGADMSGARLTGVDLADVIVDDSTRWPHNFTR
ncbi:pentapeptide repeat-containing protein [Kibdelosporangium lantanae]|uniref:Pentapeptide repeat-containing protein n=1 Tax=Kibdelosporangium lantanae TaxID=1497396 RepID=A0ABW3M1T6_9PSEU